LNFRDADTIPQLTGQVVPAISYLSLLALELTGKEV